MNKDSFPDLIVGGDPHQSNIFNGKIYVLLGKGNGSFHPTQEYPVGYNSSEVFPAPYIEQIEVGDMNNDGNLDVVVAHNGERNFTNRSVIFATILFGDGRGNLQPDDGYIFYDGTGGNVISAITLADMNKDNLLDVVLAINVGTDLANIWILKNLGDGNFQNIGRKLIGANIYGIAGINLNEDSYQDLVMTTHLGVIIGYGSELVFPTVFEQRDENIFEEGLTVRDFNSDGRMDFAVVPRLSPQIRVFLNSQRGVSKNPVVYQTGFLSSLLKSADFDGDGKLDLIISDSSDSNFQIFYGNGNGEFSSSEVIRNNVGVSDFTTADFDMNGKIDIAVSIPAQSPYKQAGVLLNAPNQRRYYTDFDGDAESDFTIFRPTTGTWWKFHSSNQSVHSSQFGLPTDKIVPGNYDGDNKADIAVFRDGIWYILQSSDRSLKIEFWGTGEDIPVPADYDNDGKMDIAVFRPSDGIWYIKNELGLNAVKWGINSDKPVPSDYDGDGKTDIAVFRPEDGTWYILNSKDGQIIFQRFGLAEDKPVPADYDGDGKTDIAVYRNGNWYLLQSSQGFVGFQFGLATDLPCPADYDGDGKTDAAVFRDGIWYLLQSKSGFAAVQFGLSIDQPIPNIYVK